MTETIPVLSALQVLAGIRRDDQIVVTNQGSARIWPAFSDHPLDFNYNPSTMSGAVPLGLGLALAQPHRDVIVVSGDGSLLMSLGCLVTVMDSGATNLSVVLLDNGSYEVTGGQKTPSARTSTDFAGIATAAGFPSVFAFQDTAQWQRSAHAVFAAAGPRFVALRVGPKPSDFIDPPAKPITTQLQHFC